MTTFNEENTGRKTAFTPPFAGGGKQPEDCASHDLPTAVKRAGKTKGTREEPGKPC